MSFYGDWKNGQGNEEKEDLFLQQFLDYSPASLDALIKGDKADVVEAIKVILPVSMNSSRVCCCFLLKY